MKDHQFCEVLAQLIPPIPLVNYGQYATHQSVQHFYLLSFQRDKILGSRQVVHITADGVPTTTTHYPVQVQLRFSSSSESSSETQNDFLPADLLIWINDKLFHSPNVVDPGIPRKRLSSPPFDITTSVMYHSSNSIAIRWLAEPGHNFSMSVNLVRKLTAQELFTKLMAKPVKPLSSTKQVIKELITKPSEDSDLCAPTSLRVSLNCPLGKSRMRYPCRGVNCKHLQCFDANSFLMMNEKKPTFLCPVCSEQLKFSDLIIDGYFRDVIKNWSNMNLGSGTHVELLGDGSWLPVCDKVCGESPENQKLNRKSPTDLIIETIDLVDEDDDKENDIFILNPVHHSSSTLDFFRPYFYGKETKSTGRNSSLCCGKVSKVNYLPKITREAEVIEILD